MPTCFQILNQVEHVEETSVERAKGAVNQPVAKDQKNLDIWANISIKRSFLGDNVT